MLLIERIKNSFSILALLSVVLFSSCIKEKIDGDCFKYAVYVDHKFVLNVQEIDKFRDFVEYVDLYVYNENSKLAYTYRFTRAQLAETDFAAKLMLPEGKFNIVTWMNQASAEFEIKNKISLTDAVMELKLAAGAISEKNITPIYYGRTTQDVVVIPDPVTDLIVPIELTKNTNIIELSLIHDASTPAGTTFEVTILAANSTSNFSDNKPTLATPIMTYKPRVVSSVPYTERMDFTTLRLWATDGAELSVVAKKNGEADVPIDLGTLKYLTPLIMQNPIFNTDYKLEINDLFPISITITYNPADLSYVVAKIMVGDWEAVDTGVPI